VIECREGVGRKALRVGPGEGHGPGFRGGARALSRILMLQPARGRIDPPWGPENTRAMEQPK